MNGLVGHEFLQESPGSRLPGNAPELQEIHIEPGGEKILEIVIQGGQERIFTGQRDEVRPKIHQELHSLGESVEAGQDACPGTFGGPPQRSPGPTSLFRGPGGPQVIQGFLDVVFVQVELGGHQAQEILSARGVQRHVGLAQGSCPGTGQHLAALGLQAGFHLRPDERPIFPGKGGTEARHVGIVFGPGDELPAPVEGLEALPEEAGSVLRAHGGPCFEMELKVPVTRVR